MARIARIVAPDIPHHITQRGNQKQKTFFCYEDYQLYLDLLAQWCRHFQVEIWAYCLMPNHVHLIAVPSTQKSLAKAIGKTHERYTRHVNFREGWRGHLWQGRFASYPMDEPHLLAATRYIELNPVKANIVACPQEQRQSAFNGPKRPGCPRGASSGHGPQLEGFIGRAGYRSLLLPSDQSMA